MNRLQKSVLYILLVFLGVSLIGPGLSGMFRTNGGTSILIAESTDAMSHLRAVNAMMTGIGIAALKACFDLEHARPVVVSLGIILAVLVIARVYSILIDGMPGFMSVIYLAVEAVMSAAFLIWPPPARF